MSTIDSAPMIEEKKQPTHMWYVHVCVVCVCIEREGDEETGTRGERPPEKSGEGCAQILGLQLLSEAV